MGSFLKKSSFSFQIFLFIWSETEFEVDYKNSHFQNLRSELAQRTCGAEVPFDILFYCLDLIDG
jgi:hypothetical protein